MNRKLWVVGLGLFLVCFTMVTAAPAKVDLNIAAAASLKDVMTELQANYQQIKPNVKLYFNLGASGSLQTQIEQGAPADLFISAAQKQMDNLAKEGLIKTDTRCDLLENQLVMIVPKTGRLSIKNFNDLTSEAVKKIGIGAPESVPAGQYAKEVFTNLKIWEPLQGKLVMGTDVRAVLTYVATGNVDAGIVYRTDAAISDQVKIVAAAPKGSHQPIIYPAAVLANAKQPQAAADFLKYLAGKKAKKIFEKYGFKMAQ